MNMKYKKSQAAVLVENQAPLVIETIQLPQMLSYGQVLVKVHYTTICGAQLNEIDAAKGPDKYLPHLLGHEASATVIEVGEGVKFVKTGDLVVMHWRKGAGVQAEPAKYFWKNKTVNAGWVTTFQEYSVVSENRLTVIPKNFDKKIAPLFGCAVTTAMGVVNNDATIKVGQAVVVFGAGGVGLNIIQASSLVSANPIIAIDLIEEKLKLSRKYGATHTINAKLPDVDAQIKKIVGEKGADVVIDTTGNGRVIERSYELTHPDGKTILVGVPRVDDKVSIYTLPLHFKKVLKGSEGGSSEPNIDIPRYIRLVESGKLNLQGIITHEFPLDKINEAITLVRSGNAGRVEIAM